MGFFDSLRKAFSGSPRPAGTYWIYARCRRCGEPLCARVDLRNEPSQADDGETWVVRKGLIGSGAERCFETVEVVLHFDQQKLKVIDSHVTGGELITEEEYQRLSAQRAEPSEGVVDEEADSSR